jgi:arylformamidase
LEGKSHAIDGAWLDQQYNPRLSVMNVPEIFALWESDSAAARKNARNTSRLDLAYGDKPTQQLDVFYSTQNGTSSSQCPTLVFIHGGYWRMMDKRTFSFIAQTYTAAGINVVLTNYSLCPSVNIADICLEQAHAIAWIYRNASHLDLDRNRLFVSGHSAGGHLCAMMLATRWKLIDKNLPKDVLKGGIALSGLFDLRPLAIAPFLAADIRLDEMKAIAVSPALMSANFKTPLILALGELESGEFHRQDSLLTDAWKHNVRQNFSLVGTDHFTICDRFCDPNEDLFKATLALLA